MKTKNPVMVLAGQKAAQTRKANLLAKTTEFPSLTKVATIKSEDFPKELLERFDKFVGRANKNGRLYELDAEWYMRLDAGVDPNKMEPTIYPLRNNDPLRKVLFELVKKLDGCDYLRIV